MKTHVILDGLADPEHGRELSARWAQAGLLNTLDVSGQCAAIWKQPDTIETTDDAHGRSEPKRAQAVGTTIAECDKQKPSHDNASRALTEHDMDRAAGVARAFGIELRDRAGASFVAANALDALRKRAVYEYKSRLATALMFGLPAIALHYIGPWLASGTGNTSDMLYPWLFEMLLVGWSIVAAGWPMLWQGTLSLIHLRQTGDLLSSIIVLVAFVPSALGVIGLIARIEPFYAADGPLFHAAIYMLLLVLTQRWLLHRSTPQLSGRAMLLIPRIGRLIGLWMIAAAVVLALNGWEAAIAFAMLLPPLVSFLSINPWTPGYAALLPTFAFAALMLLDRKIGAGSLDSVRIEVAFGFGLLQTMVMVTGWKKIGLAQ